MPTFHGIVPDDTGRYTLASLHKNKSGGGKCRFSQWSFHDKIPRPLLHRGVRCGLPVSWLRSPSGLVDKVLAAQDAAGRLLPAAETAVADLHKAALEYNLLAIVPDDSFLCTLPLYCAGASAPSFLSVFVTEAYCEIGVTVAMKLVAVFKMAPGSDEAVEAHLGRIRRYWNTVSPDEPFPNRVYLFNARTDLQCEGFIVVPLHVRIGNRNIGREAQLRALGCALAGVAGDVPLFPCPKTPSWVRRLRASLIVGTAAAVAIALLSLLVPLCMSGIAQRRLNAYESQYQNLMVNNTEIRTIQRRNDSLARSILRAQKKSSRQTHWGRFLDALGASRPPGLYFDKLGSEPVKGSAIQVRIAISGSAKSETLVTDFMARLQKNAAVSNLSLSLVEKNEKMKSICNFRILCVINITDM